MNMTFRVFNPLTDLSIRTKCMRRIKCVIMSGLAIVILSEIFLEDLFSFERYLYVDHDCKKCDILC